MRRFQSLGLVGAVAALVVAAFAASAWAQRPAAPPPKGTRIQGHVVRVQGPNQFVVRTADKREVILHTHPRTRFLLNERAVRFTDLREKAAVDILFDETEGRNVASSVTIAGDEEPGTEIVEGEVVRVLEPQNELVVRTVSGKEVILVTHPRTTFTINERSARLVDFRPGTAVKVRFNVKDRKNMAHSIVTRPKR